MIEKNDICLLWYKRDIRVYDHEPLQKAIQTGLPILPFYVFEPSIMAYPDWDIRHGRFIYQSILDLENHYPNLKIAVFQSEMGDVFAHFQAHFNIKYLFIDLHGL